VTLAAPDCLSQRASCSFVPAPDLPLVTDQSNALSIEEFAASIAASLATTAVPGEPTAPALPAEQLSFRERVQRRVGTAELLVFRVGGELFGVELVAVEEALDMPVIHRLPEMPPSMLGVFTLRGALVSVFAPQDTLGIPYQDAATVVVFCGGDRRVALAADDVDDVLSADLKMVRAAPGSAANDGALLGVVRRGQELVALLDAQSLVAAHRSLAAVVSDVVKETL
jgi:purine-binding chemotaxis protein CheW